MKTKAILTALALTLGAAVINAQDSNPRPPREGGPGGPGAPGGPGRGGQRPVPPLMQALDANNDGELDAKEIANASAALGKLDKNGDGKISGDEIRPMRREGPPPGDGAERPDRPNRPRPPQDQ